MHCTRPSSQCSWCPARSWTARHAAISSSIFSSALVRLLVAAERMGRRRYGLIDPIYDRYCYAPSSATLVDCPRFSRMLARRVKNLGADTVDSANNGAPSDTITNSRASTLESACLPPLRTISSALPITLAPGLNYRGRRVGAAQRGGDPTFDLGDCARVPSPPTRRRSP